MTLANVDGTTVAPSSLSVRAVPFWHNVYPSPPGVIGDDDMIPAGLIAWWSGPVASIPAGWVLCDGANGTPDLRDRFVIGADAATAGMSGGAVSPAAPLPDHAAHAVTQPNPHAVTQPNPHAVTQPNPHADHASHAHAYTDVPAHTHPQSIRNTSTAGAAGTQGASTANNATVGVTGSTGVASGTTQGPGAALAHGAHVGAAVDAHAGAAVDAHAGAAVDAHSAHAAPLWYALAFIMKV